MSARITLANVGYEFSNGVSLFSNFNFSVQSGPLGIVGANGLGKSVLLKLMAGIEKPSHGTIQHQGKIAYVPQSWTGDASVTGAQVLGVDKALRAWERIRQGSVAVGDFTLVEQVFAWDFDLWQQKFLELCQLVGSPVTNAGLLTSPKPMGCYSGGEQLAILWLSALLKKPDIVLLDEPTNHLDRPMRSQLLKWLKENNLLTLVVSHDRELLTHVVEILELTQHGFEFHSGNYSVYQQNRQQRIANQLQQQYLAKGRLKKERADAQAALEKAEQRAAKGKRKAAKRDLSKLEVDGMKDQAVVTQGKNKKLQQNRIGTAQSHYQEVQAQMEWNKPIEFELPDSRVPSNKQILAMKDYQSRFSQHPALSLAIQGSRRIHIEGPNGCGKSLLLAAVAGRQTQFLGTVENFVTTAYLDQHHSTLKDSETALENYQRLAPGFTAQEYRDRLAWLRLRAQKGQQKVASFSGGEKLKLALACELLGPETPQLLLLDEPSNHLDLDSIQALEQAITHFAGAMIVVSHDRHFVDSLQLTDRLHLATGDIAEI